MHQSDLPQLLLQKAPGSLELLQQQYAPMLRYCIRGILPDPQDQEECLSDLMMLVWNRADAYDPKKGAFPAWLATLSHNTALNHARSIQRRLAHQSELSPALPDPSPSPEAQLLRDERARRIRAAADSLPRTERLLFYRKYYYQQSTAQIAAELGLSPRAVEGRLYRLRQKLRKELGDEFYG